MKVVCDGCSTRYSLDDDKLTGKVFKIRCRTCDRSIVVRGEPSAALASGAVASTIAPEAHVAAGEGSGLLDIRALAHAYAQVARPDDAARTRSPALAAAGTPPAGTASDLPVFASGAFVAPSVLVPPVRRRDRRIVVGLATSLGLLAICVTLLLVVMLTRDGQPAAAGTPRSARGLRVAAAEQPAHPRTAAPAVIEAPSTQAAPSAAPAAASAAPAAASAAPAAPSAPLAPAPAAVMPAAQARPPAAQAQPPAAQPRPPAAQARPPAAQAQPAAAQPRPAAAQAQPAAAQAEPPTALPGPAAAQAEPPAAPPQPAAAPAGAACDQVTCVVNGYDGDCCRAFQRGAPPSPAGQDPARPALPENLDRAAIAAGLATISTKRCGGAASATGLVKAQLKVSAAGEVTSVTVQSSPDDALSACVVEQAKQGRFQPTQRGASFSYVWRF